MGANAAPPSRLHSVCLVLLQVLRSYIRELPGENRKVLREDAGENRGGARNL